MLILVFVSSSKWTGSQIDVVYMVSHHFILWSDHPSQILPIYHSTIQSEPFMSLKATSRNKGVYLILWAKNPKQACSTLSFTVKLRNDMTIKWKNVAWNDLTMEHVTTNKPFHKLMLGVGDSWKLSLLLQCYFKVKYYLLSTRNT